MEAKKTGGPIGSGDSSLIFPVAWSLQCTCMHTQQHIQHQSCWHTDGAILPDKSGSICLGRAVVPSGAQGELGMLAMLDCPSVWSELLGVSEIEQQFTVQ